jgi:hypothetical protein
VRPRERTLGKGREVVTEQFHRGVLTRGVEQALQGLTGAEYSEAHLDNLTNEPRPAALPPARTSAEAGVPRGREVVCLGLHRPPHATRSASFGNHPQVGGSRKGRPSSTETPGQGLLAGSSGVVGGAARVLGRSRTAQSPAEGSRQDSEGRFRACGLAFGHAVAGVVRGLEVAQGL